MGPTAHENAYRGNANSNSSRSSLSSPSSSTNKPSYQKVGKHSLKKLKFHSKSCEDASKQEQIFLKLDPNNPQHAHKIQQRRKAITKGKNTIGYDYYLRAVPKEKRQKRSMVTPSTPDHTLDIPNKKWNGMVRSWRVALHRYDPVDLRKSFAAAQEAALTERQNASQSPADSHVLTAKEKEIANSGLTNLVQISTSNNSDSTPRKIQSSSPRTPSTTNIFKNVPIATPDDDQYFNQGGIASEFNRWDAAREEDIVFFSEEDDDSDDDLL